MRLDYLNQSVYRYTLPMFKGDEVTERVRNGLNNVLNAYARLSRLQAEATDNNIQNYKLEKVFIVGSGARTNRVDSDMDLLFIVPNLDESSAKNLNLVLDLIYQTDRPKNEAIDVYVRKEDIFPYRESINITPQVDDLIERCNSDLN